MYDALIVEDSKPILRNIQNLLGSLELPVRIAATAANGEEALEYLKRQPIQILLTDIRMPKMDGLTLIEEAKRINPLLKVVLISGYSDFEYTRKALNLQVFDYLLKPVERLQLKEVMDRVLEQLGAQTDRDAEMLKEIVGPGDQAEFQLAEPLRHYGRLVLVISRQPFTAWTEKWRCDELQTGLHVMFQPYACQVFPTRGPEHFLVLVQGTAQERYSSLYELLESARHQLEDRGILVSIGGQREPTEPGQLTELYYRIADLLKEQQRTGRGVAIDTGAALSRLRSGDGQLFPALSAGFTELIRGRRKEQFRLRLAEQLAKWESDGVHLVELERFVGLLVDTFSLLSAAEQDSEARLDLEADARKLFEADSYRGFADGLIEWSGRCFDMLSAHHRKSGEALFRQMDEFVRMNMYSQLSINDVALKFHVSPSYISRIIKRFTQSTFVQYYTGLKIKEACQLMESRPDMKVKELSDALSFSDQHYFSKVFKEYTGFSPTEYKEKRLGRQPATQQDQYPSAMVGAEKSHLTHGDQGN